MAEFMIGFHFRSVKFLTILNRNTSYDPRVFVMHVNSAQVIDFHRLDVTINPRETIHFPIRVQSSENVTEIGMCCLLHLARDAR